MKLTRLKLDQHAQFCGAQAILWELEDQHIRPLPSLRTVNRILRRHDLIQRRTRRYQPKGTPYPSLPAGAPNDRHQADFVGPRHLKGEAEPVRFYSMNVVDLATRRCATQPCSAVAATPSMQHSGRFGSAWGCPDISRSIMKWPSMAVPPIPGAWDRSSACACIMASPSGSSRPPNPGAMAWSKGSITTTNRNSSTGCPCRPKQHCAPAP